MLVVSTRNVPRSAETRVFLKTKASIPLIANILANTRAKEIVCSRAIRNTIPPRALAALRRMRIKVRVTEFPRGRPRKHSDKTRSRALKLLSSGKSFKTVSRKLGIPLRTVYHIRETLRKANKTKGNKK